MGRKRQEDTASKPTVGMMALAATAKHIASNVWPLVCQVLKCHERTATVRWYTGARTTQWRVCNTRIGSSIAPFDEDILIGDIYLHSFSLTGTRKLPKSVQDESLEYLESYL